MERSGSEATGSTLTGTAWTRRERLERIANAERDRRAGRAELAVAALGEATEWPARVVLALTQLPAEACAEARRILEDGLDAWAEELGLPDLDLAPEAVPDAGSGLELEVEPEAVERDPRGETQEAVLVEDDAFSTGDTLEALELSDEPRFGADPYLEALADGPAREASPAPSLAVPLAVEELDRAFDEAQAQTDEMHDVNRVAERVLLEEPLGLAELSGEALDAAEVPTAVELGEAPATSDWRASAGWPGVEVGPALAAFPVEEAEAADFPDALDTPEGTPEARSRTRILATLERWLDNLERHRSGRA